MKTEADRIVAAAAINGELPVINQENRQAFGLTKNRRRVDDQGWIAWWTADLKNGGTSGITQPSTRFRIPTTDLAHDGKPWPNMWSLNLWRQIATPGREDDQLAFARRFDLESPQFGFTQITPVIGAHKPITVRCNCCGAQREHAKVRGLINPQVSPNRCFAKEGPGVKSGATLARKAGDGFNNKLAARGIDRRIDPADYVGAKKPIWCSCDCEEGGHMQTPTHILKGYRTCRSARRQKMANGKISAGQMGQMGQMVSGGTPYDSPRSILAGERHKSESQTTFLYLHATDVAGINVFGITNDPSGRPRHGTWYGEALIDPIPLPVRSFAVLIEGYFKEPGTGWIIDRPAAWGSRGGATEITDGSPEDFQAMAMELIGKLSSMSYMLFIEEYLPSQSKFKTMAQQL